VETKLPSFDFALILEMPARIFRRKVLTATREELGRLHQPSRPRRIVPPVLPAELERQRLRRIEKAERDERMDISMSLTPVKTYVLHRYPERFFLPTGMVIDISCTFQLYGWFHATTRSTSDKLVPRGRIYPEKEKI
jgi:hypothetical protein